MTRGGLEQEQALQIVAMHDADALVEALLPGLAAARATMALLNWRTHYITGEPRTQRQIEWACQEHTQWVSLNQLPTHAVLMRRYLDLPPPVTAAAITQPQQAQHTSAGHIPATVAHTTEDSDQRQQPQLTARQRRLREYNEMKANEMRLQQQSDLQCRRKCKTTAQVTPTRESSAASMPATTLTHEGRQRALELQLYSFLDEAEEVSQA